MYFRQVHLYAEMTANISGYTVCQQPGHVYCLYTIWSQAAEIKILADLNLAVALHSVIRHYKHCERVYRGALPSSCLRYLNKAVSSQIYKKYNWQHVNDELAIYVQLAK